MATKVTFTGTRPTELAKKISRTVRVNIPRDVKIAGLKHFTDSFRNEGFTDETLERWKERKNNKKSRGRAILVQSAKLSRSIDAIVRNDGVTFVSRGVVYAEIHNTGGRAGRLLKAIIPQRKFMGKSARLLREVHSIIIKHLNRI
jgi:phage gpG-like protein